MRVVVDRSKCTALGNCEAIAPEYFEVNDEGLLEILRPDVDEADLADAALSNIKRAVSGCPMAALSLED